MGKGLRARSISESFSGKLLKLLRRGVGPVSGEKQEHNGTIKIHFSLDLKALKNVAKRKATVLDKSQEPKTK